MKEVLSVTHSALGKFAIAVTYGDARTIKSALAGTLTNANCFSLRDESLYTLVVLTLLHASMRDYDVKSEREISNSRNDINLKLRRSGLSPMIFELKRSKYEKDLKSDVEKALSRIHGRRYYMDMNGDVILVGISFWDKMPCMKTETLHLDW